MKNLKKYLIAGMIGVGSWGIFGNAKGQEKDTIYKKIMLNVLDYNCDGNADEYSFYFLDPRINILIYKDRNFDGEIDIYSWRTYNLSTRGYFELIDNLEYADSHKSLIKKFQNHLIGTYQFDDEEKKCGGNNEPIDCLVDLF